MMGATHGNPRDTGIRRRRRHAGQRTGRGTGDDAQARLGPCADARLQSPAARAEGLEFFIEGAIGLLWDDMKAHVPADRVDALRAAFYAE